MSGGDRFPLIRLQVPGVEQGRGAPAFAGRVVEPHDQEDRLVQIGGDSAPQQQRQRPPALPPGRETGKQVTDRLHLLIDQRFDPAVEPAEASNRTPLLANALDQGAAIAASFDRSFLPRRGDAPSSRVGRRGRYGRPDDRLQRLGGNGLLRGPNALAFCGGFRFLPDGFRLRLDLVFDRVGDQLGALS